MLIENLDLSIILVIIKFKAFTLQATFQSSHENIARIELLPADMARFMASGLYEKTVSKFKELGFAYVTLDLQGYRMGSLNETLKGK